ncbi:MAG: MBL fold metallo-hydrolase [Candidatus Dormibacteria bacterium]
MQTPYTIADETFILPSVFPIPGIGLLYLNAMVIRGAEPVLVDTGAPVFRDEYLNAAFSLIEPTDVRWIFLSHDDRDHSGNLIQLLDLCPNARVVTNSVGVGRMGEEWELPMNRVYFLNDGESFNAGDRILTAIRPPYFDSPATRGLWDPTTRVYYGVDSFGAPVPHACESVTDVPADAYENGFNWFNRANHPWHEFTDPAKIDAQIGRIRALSPDVIVSYHGPALHSRTEQACDMLSAISTMDRLELPSQQDLEAMMAAPAGNGHGNRDTEVLEPLAAG